MSDEKNESAKVEANGETPKADVPKKEVPKADFPKKEATDKKPAEKTIHVKDDGSGKEIIPDSISFAFMNAGCFLQLACNTLAMLPNDYMNNHPELGVLIHSIMNCHRMCRPLTHEEAMMMGTGDKTAALFRKFQAEDAQLKERLAKCAEKKAAEVKKMGGAPKPEAVQKHNNDKPNGENAPSVPPEMKTVKEGEKPDWMKV